ncbi:MAG: HD domain-containing protein, partial [Actinobacteria bacterium]|nr:HD domain-containing protein [Actinomycetota bacterium]
MNVADVRPREPVASPFLVGAVDRRASRTGEPFLHLSLRDSRGDAIPARFFRVPAAVAEAIRAGETYDVEGDGDDWGGTLQIKVRTMRRSEVQWDATAMLPRASKDPADLLAIIQQAAAALGSPAIRRVVEHVLASEPVASRLATWPAAKSRHHAWVAGLAEHIVEMLQIAERVADTFPDLNSDLLIAGVILHDLGKVEELDLGATFAYTAAGNLEGHMVQGVRLLDASLAATGCDAGTGLQLRHLVLSHQGTLEWSAVVEPLTPEAIALHYIDQLSSQVRPALDDVLAARNRGAAGTIIRGPTALRNLYVSDGSTPGGGTESAA